jgi:N-acetylglutamate synthase-like GNAT family acetyltransferase/predicted metal-dependent hydrolase
MSKKSAKIAAMIESFQGQARDAHYLGYFGCFNEGLYYEAHDVLEEMWLPARGQHADHFYKGLIQLAGAFVHLQKNRLGPSNALFELARANLEKYPGYYESLNVAHVLNLIANWQRRLRKRPNENPLQTHKPPRLALSDYEISTDAARLDLDVIHNFLSNSYWAKDISRELVERSIRHSLCFGIFRDGKQVGFARVISDFATFAYLADVFVLPEHRGKGVSKQLMETILEHHDLQGLRRFMLATLDAHGLYAQFGFEALDHPERYMSIHRPNLYSSGG